MIKWWWTEWLKTVDDKVKERMIENSGWQSGLPPKLHIHAIRLQQKIQNTAKLNYVLSTLTMFLLTYHSSLLVQVAHSAPWQTSRIHKTFYGKNCLANFVVYFFCKCTFSVQMHTQYHVKEFLGNANCRHAPLCTVMIQFVTHNGAWRCLMVLSYCYVTSDTVMHRDAPSWFNFFSFFDFLWRSSRLARRRRRCRALGAAGRGLPLAQCTHRRNYLLV